VASSAEFIGSRDRFTARLSRANRSELNLNIDPTVAHDPNRRTLVDCSRQQGRPSHLDERRPGR